MIDYLELLLEEQEMEENRKMPEWKRRNIPRSVGMAQRDTERWEHETVHSVDEVYDRVRLEQEQRDVGVWDSMARDVLRQDLTVEILRLRRAVRNADARNGRLREQSGGAVGTNAGVSWNDSRPIGSVADYAALVDAAFARDARRYDGLPGLL